MEEWKRDGGGLRFFEESVPFVEELGNTSVVLDSTGKLEARESILLQVFLGLGISNELLLPRTYGLTFGGIRLPPNSNNNHRCLCRPPLHT